jgi:microcystin-dependent protein
MTLYKWSQTASSDATADPTINWAEGQSPSSINDSARAMMAATAKYRDDIAGAIVTSGTSTAYAISSYQVFDTLAHVGGQMIAFTPHTTNGAGPVTLNVDSLGSKPLRSAPNVELLAGTIIQGTPYVATYNNSDGAFYLQGFFGNPYNVPLGSGFDYWAPSAPNSCFAFPYGQTISRVTYSTLFALFGTTYGGGDGSTTFNLPDCRGRVTAKLDNMGGTAASRLTSSYFGANASSLGATGGSEGHTLTAGEIPAHTHPSTLTDLGHAHTGSGIGVSQLNPGSGTSNIFIVQGNGSKGSTDMATTGITINNAANTGGGSPHAIVQPTIVCNYILRIF